MKYLFLAFFVSMQVFVATDALAWSPMGSYRSAPGTAVQCQWLTAGSEQNQQDQNENETEEEEEEEPDCD